MLDSDLARIYGTSTGALNRAVKRNRDRFPTDFQFQISPAEWKNLKCQIGTSSSTHGGRRRGRPYAFTEHGAIMAANVLNSRRAVQMSVGACPERSRTGRARISSNASVARRQTRTGKTTSHVGEGAKAA